ncbi:MULTISPECIES: ATP-grasp domain-containing protein [unclassified Brachybacterium]|uniref:ATP-grasp domain-containing protein n=1 Tax=unclassified Brachybacterium TaxID=2623841 RepID=UPI004033823C
MTRIGIVITHPDTFLAADPELDSVPLVAALRRRGVHAEQLVWHDGAVDWASYDLVVLRSPWDYSLRPAEFEAWLDRAAGLTRVLNEPELVRWNMDKRYLEQLAAAGIPGVPTSHHDTEESLVQALAAACPAADGAVSADEAPHVILKPTVGAGALQTGLFVPEDPAALALGREILVGGGVVMLQPEVVELSEGREKALYVVDGRFTHAIAKGALLARGGGLLGGTYRERPAVVEATPQERDFAEQVLAAVAQVTGLPTPLYGRIDVVVSARYGLVLLEAELFEPLFNLPLVSAVTETFAEAILARL